MFQRLLLAALFTANVAYAVDNKVEPTELSGGVYLASPPTLTGGTRATLLLDSTGALITTTGGGGIAATVTNAGTFAVQNTAATPAGANVIGHVIADTGSTTAVTGNVTAVQATGTNLHTVVDSGTVTTVSTVTNLSQMNGAAITMGNGVSGTGVQRVTLASDSTGVVSLATGANTIGALTANQSVNAAQINGVTPLMGNGASGTGALRVSIANDSTGVVSLATGANVIGSLTANQSTNIAQMNGVATTMGNGVSGTGVQRVTLASDSTGVVSLATGANVIGSLTANQSTNIAQMNGVATTMGNGVSGTGVQRVTIASDSTGVVSLATGANTIGALTANQSVNVAQVGGTAVVADPCASVAKTSTAISQATSTQVITGTSAKKTYLCSIFLQLAATTENVSITAGTGSVCATGASAIIGSTTVASGLVIPASGGFTLGNGAATVASGTVNADNVCIIQTGSVRISGVITWVQI